MGVRRTSSSRVETGNVRAMGAAVALSAAARYPRPCLGSVLSRSVSAINVSTLIMATPNDAIYPVSFAETLAGAVPHASLEKLAHKTVPDFPGPLRLSTRLSGP